MNDSSNNNESNKNPFGFNFSINGSSADNSGGDSDNKGGLGGIFGGLNNLLKTVQELAEKGEELKNSGALDQDGKSVQYGFSIKTASGGSSDGTPSYKVEPFGNVKTDDAGHATVSETREPPTDVFDDGTTITVICEMPGIADSDITLDLNGDVLELTANSNEKSYAKTILLPAIAQGEPSLTCNNGVATITLSKAASNESDAA